jgi:hypothetical protein
MPTTTALNKELNMVTATKKVAAKKTIKPLEKKAKDSPAKAIKQPDKTFAMPQEVKDWIERANSIMMHQGGEIQRLKQEVTELKAYKKWAEHRILRSDHE